MVETSTFGSLKLPQCHYHFQNFVMRLTVPSAVPHITLYSRNAFFLVITEGCTNIRGKKATLLFHFNSTAAIPTDGYRASYQGRWVPTASQTH